MTAGMDKDQRPDAARERDLASPNPAESGKASSSRPSDTNVAPQGNADVPGEHSPGDYQSLPDDLDGMHNDSWNPAVQAAGSTEEAAEAARQAASDAGREVDPLFAGSPGEEGPAPNIPSTLNMDTSASAARTGHEQMRERERQHTETGPGVTGGDVDADWMSGEFVGDETPAGDNPTPGMSTVEGVGQAMGVDYQDTEELKAVDKIAERDRHRWELDPASSEDYAERNRDDGTE